MSNTRAILTLGTVSVIVVLAILSLPLDRPRGPHPGRHCAMNLRGLGTALFTYSMRFDRQFPPQLGVFVLDGSVSPHQFQCDCSGTQIPDGMTREQCAEWVNAHSDYVYIWPPEGVDVDPDRVVMYEPVRDHEDDFISNLFGDNQDDFINILFGDTHVDRVPLAQAQQLLRKQGIDLQYTDRGQIGSKFLWLLLPAACAALLFWRWKKRGRSARGS